MINESLYLSQSYKDAWSDHIRSLNNPDFPVWDYVILTASDEHQAEGFRAQLKEREAYLPKKSRYVVIPDEGNVRIGSGGATLSVLKYIRSEEGSFSGLRILVIHSGGDSKRVPQYSALGKLFSPVPHELPDGRPSTLFDEFIITMSAVPGRIREGMLVLSGDVLLLFNPLLIDYSGHGAACISFKESAETGKNHGVFLRSEEGFMRAFLHKQNMDNLRRAGAVNETGAVDIDTGAVIFGADVLDALYGLISDKGQPDEDKYRGLVNDKVRLSLYGDLYYPLSTEGTFEEYLKQPPEGESTEELINARMRIWDAISSFNMKVMRMAPAKFIHFGTTREVLSLMTKETARYKNLDWTERTCCAMDERASGYNSVLGRDNSIGENCYIEVSYVHDGAEVGRDTVISYLDIEDGTRIPPGVVMHGLKQSNGKFVCRIYGVDDNPKEDRIFGKKLPHPLWQTRLYPECNTIQEAIDKALDLYNRAMNEKDAGALENKDFKSMAEGFRDADHHALLDWSRRMADLVKMNDIAGMIEAGESAAEAPRLDKLTDAQKEWLDRRSEKADFGKVMRLHYYVGCALGGAYGEKETGLAFKVLRQRILEETLKGLKENTKARIVKDRHEISLPLRVNWGGGWSDTPPYCNEQGGTVINAAILVKGDRPVKVTFNRLDEKKVIFESRDMDVHGEFDDISKLQSVGDPYDPYVLQKSALLACGIIPDRGGSLDTVLERLGGGFMINTEVAGIPKGSGLGTSSILAAACVKGLFEFFGIDYTEDDLYSHVLCMEQIMSTGGGWQDQVGGVTDGIKYTTSAPGLHQRIKVEHVKPDDKTWDELDRRFCLIYTGQRRLARNLLRDVVGRYIGNEKDTVFALNEIQRVAALMKFEIERGHVDDFAALMDRHWELSKMIDAGSTNTLIDQIFDSVDDLLSGRMICGAGGGGFLQVMLRENVSRDDLQKRLWSVFQDTDIGAWECELCRL